MNTYKIIFTRENGTQGTDHFTAINERQARKDFGECYRHGTATIISIELASTNAPATKQQERDTLEKIRKMVEQLGPDSYLATAFEGCFDLAAENIDNDWACSMADRARRAEKRAAELEEMLSNASTAMSNLLSKVNSIIQQLPGKIWTHLVNAVNKVIAWGQQMLSNASTAMSNMLSKVNSIIQELPGKIWTHLVNAVNKVVAWGQQMVSNASTAASNMLSKVSSTLQQLPGKVWDYLSQAAQKVVTWGSQLAQKGAAAATQLFNSIVNGLASLPSKMAEIGSNIVSGIWNGISSGWNWLTNKVSSLANSLLDAAKDALGINSPSKEFADEVGRWIMPGVGKGLDKSMPATLKDMKAKAGELVSAMRAEMSASAGQLTVGASHAAGLRMAGAGTTVYNDNRMEQSNTYNVPVATPSEVAKKQREALRNMVGGVK